MGSKQVASAELYQHEIRLTKSFSYLQLEKLIIIKQIYLLY
jgi:hypothetical protein